MKDKTKLTKAIQRLNQVKNTCFKLGYGEYFSLIAIRNSLIKKLERLKDAN